MAFHADRFEFVSGRYSGEAPAIGCDGLVAGASLELTHWQGNRTPPELKADTSTEIALNFVGRPDAARWTGAVVVNNHFDTDGALSVWALLEPELALPQRALLVAAAEAGDFDEWPAIDRGLWLDTAVRTLAVPARDDAEAYALVIPRLAKLVAHLDDERALWEHEWQALQSAVRSFDARRVRPERRGGVGLMRHAPGEPECPGALLAREFLPGTRRYLLAFEQADALFGYRYERPRYAWAETVVRPPCPAPDAEALAAALGPEWTSDDLPGMTGIVQTRRPVPITPDDLIRRLATLDVTTMA
jgi:hypothetical protein